MQKRLISGALILLTGPALAAERTVTLAVDNMTCASCPYIVEKSLERVDGVVDATVSYEANTAVVRFEKTRTGIDALTRATAAADYPVRLAK